MNSKRPQQRQVRRTTHSRAVHIVDLLYNNSLPKAELVSWTETYLKAEAKKLLRAYSKELQVIQDRLQKELDNDQD